MPVEAKGTPLSVRIAWGSPSSLKSRSKIGAAHDDELESLLARQPLDGGAQGFQGREVKDVEQRTVESQSSSSYPRSSRGMSRSEAVPGVGFR
jgi:hypothetical protein